MKYIQYINEILGRKTAETDGLVLFGQNIAAGSHISGLTKGLRVGKGGIIINTPNSENTLTGLGFGMMLGGVSSIFFMKQLDFLLLGIDQIVDTYNFVRRKEPKASYTIMPVISDLGYHGLQSSFNNFGDIASVARIPGFTITNKIDAEEIINAHLVSPGFRIIGVGQRLFGDEILDVPKVYSNNEKTLFQYAEGDKATIVCFNLSFPYGWELYNKLKERGIDSSLFSVNSVTPIGWQKIIEDVSETRNLIVIDDSKSENSSCDNFIMNVLEKCQIKNKIIVKREIKGNEWLYPNPDLLQIDYETIVNKLS
ncbi:MAG: hypothetical protein UU25_C0016G0009 [Microgenomates group bacterium GW2011_GWB1_40_9]|nr:MAG: hypothetical protein UU25_C0016G0009 [Microgenomates group bacterium GW2011_GWB1_40_9]